MIEEKRNFYIDGQWVKPSKVNDLEVIDPSTEEICAIISLGSKDGSFFLIFFLFSLLASSF